jgi:hypothetical protein
VAVRVAALLQLRPADRLLDVGAGVGKFCIVVAALSGARVRGVERHPRLADVGREAARRLGVDVDLADGTLEGEDPRRVDVAYFYNPFTEPMVLRGLDSASTDRFSGRIATDVAAAERFLAAAPLGMKLVTFCGFGGSVPAGYHQLSEEVWEMGVLELWEKRDRG